MKKKVIFIVLGTVMFVAFQNLTLLPNSNLIINLSFEGPDYQKTTFQSPLAPEGVLWDKIDAPSYASYMDHETTIASGTIRNVWITGTHGASGSERSLGISVSGTAVTSETTLDKAVLHVFRHKDEGYIDIATYQRRYVSFDMKLAHNYEIPDANLDDTYTLHMQVWQEGGAPPPLAMYVQPVDGAYKRTAQVELVFVARDDNTYNGIYPVGDTTEHAFFRKGIEVGRITLDRNVWTNLVFQLEPSHLSDDRTGQFAVWQDGVRKFVYRGDWGYTPGGSTGSTNRLGFNIGVYGLRQPRLQTLFFDNIKVGGNYADHE